MKIDNFALTMFQACPAKYFLRMEEHWVGRRKSSALGFGAALHEGLAEWYKTHDKIKAITAIAETWPANMPSEDWRTREKCVQVMLDYMKTYPEESFTVVGAPEMPMVEVTFTLDTGLFLDCAECNMPPLESGTCANCGEKCEAIEYGGIFDALVEFGGNVYVFEHKTTSQMGNYYFNQFKPNNQVSGYIWAGGLLSGRRVGGAFVNAIGIYKASATKFERQITTRSAEDIAHWLTNVRSTCQQIKDCERRGFWPQYTQSCTMYGKCEFHDVHVLGSVNEQQRYLEQQFVKSEWSYETRDNAKEVES